MPSKTHIYYNSIEQYRHVLKDIKKAKENPEFDIPDVIEFTGTVKLHGTNAAVCYSNNTGMYCQSRNHIINIIYDNKGFCMFVEKNKDKFEEYFKILSKMFSIDMDVCTISLYGEWCGKLIQKGVALSELPRCFCIFDCKVSTNAGVTYWLDVSFKNSGKCVLSSPSEKIYNIYDFETFSVKINIKTDSESQKQLEEFTLYVENCCPFAKALGANGIGEGIVWRYWYGNGQRWIFKTKGERYKVTKEKTLVPVDTERVENILQFVDNTCTETRFVQAMDSLFTSDARSQYFGKIPTLKHASAIINWIRDDIVKEESDTMIKNGFTPADIIPVLSKKVCKMIRLSST